MTSPDPGFNDIANRIFGHLDDSSFCACVRVCQLLYWYLEPEWQKRRHEKQVRIRKELFEKVKPEFDQWTCHLTEKEKVEMKEFLDKLLDPYITLDLSETDDDWGWNIFLSAVHGNPYWNNHTNVLSFLLNHPNIKTITFGRKDSHDYGESWSTEILSSYSMSSLIRTDELKMMLTHPKCQPFKRLAFRMC